MSDIDPICVLDADGYCARHKERHVGTRLALSQDPGPRGQRARRDWEKPRPLAVPSRFALGVGVTGAPEGLVDRGEGPGWELKGIFRERRVDRTGCDQCKAIRDEMDRLGVEGCRREMKRVVGLLKANAKRMGWAAYLAAGARLAAAGYTSYESLVDEACRRAEAKRAKNDSPNRPDGPPPELPRGATVTPSGAGATQTIANSLPPPGPIWAVGLITVPDRRGNLLPRTIASARAAGFERPRLFVDGDNDPASWEREFGLETSCRAPRVGCYGNWMLALAELWLRDPHATRFAIMEDDVAFVRDVRGYLDRQEWPARGYLNLYANAKNRRQQPGWGPSRVRGHGALALVFDRAAVGTILTSPIAAAWPIRGGSKARKNVDGVVFAALRRVGIRELVHSPSLCQHMGDESTIGHGQGRRSTSFPGESFDAISLLGPDGAEAISEPDATKRPSAAGVA